MLVGLTALHATNTGESCLFSLCSFLHFPVQLPVSLLGYTLCWLETCAESEKSLLREFIVLSGWHLVCCLKKHTTFLVSVFHLLHGSLLLLQQHTGSPRGQPGKPGQQASSEVWVSQASLRWVVQCWMSLYSPIAHRQLPEQGRGLRRPPPPLYRQGFLRRC